MRVPEFQTLDDRFNSAISWLRIVGEWENKSPRPHPDEDFNVIVDQTLQVLSGKIADGDLGAAELLSDFELTAQAHVNPRPDLISDEGERIMKRRDQLYILARLATSFQIQGEPVTVI